MKTYHIVRKFGGGSLADLVNHQQFTKLKLSKLAVTIYNFLADLFICQNFYPSSFAKHYHLQTFPLHGNLNNFLPQQLASYPLYSYTVDM